MAAEWEQVQLTGEQVAWETLATLPLSEDDGTGRGRGKGLFEVGMGLRMDGLVGKALASWRPGLCSWLFHRLPEITLGQ